MRSTKIDDERVNFEDDMTPDEEKEYYVNEFLMVQEEYIQAKNNQEDIQKLPEGILKESKAGKIQSLIEELEVKYTEKLQYLLKNYGETIIDML